MSVTTFGYDAASRLENLTHDLPGGTTNDQTLTFTHNSAGQIVSRTGSNATYQWTPPAASTVSATRCGKVKIGLEAAGAHGVGASGRVALEFDRATGRLDVVVDFGGAVGGGGALSVVGAFSPPEGSNIGVDLSNLLPNLDLGDLRGRGSARGGAGIVGGVGAALGTQRGQLRVTEYNASIGLGGGSFVTVDGTIFRRNLGRFGRGGAGCKSK